MKVNRHGSYKVGTRVGQIKGYMSRSQIIVTSVKLNTVTVDGVV